jgi:hypothetical protein
LSTFILREGDGESPARTLQVQVVQEPGSISLIVESYGSHSMEPGHGPIVHLELYEGRLALRAWADINNEDFTLKIDLEGASESLRKEG